MGAVDLASIRASLVEVRARIDAVIVSLDGVPPVIPPHPTVTQTLARTFTALNLKIIPPTPSGGTRYALLDFFTVQQGSWNVGEYPLGVEQWAKDKYLKIIPAAGADHHLFGAIVNSDNVLKSFVPFTAWTPEYPGNSSSGDTDASGWYNLPMFASSAFDYAAGRSGPWAWSPKLPNSDVIVGGGMPQAGSGKFHVSFYAIWKEITT